jgi:hypothetical protein
MEAKQRAGLAQQELGPELPDDGGQGGAPANLEDQGVLAL